MARRKSAEDIEWEHIFSAINFETEPDPKYIKQAVIQTKTGKKFRLNGVEFHHVMAQEREQDPAHAMVESCKITLDYQKIKEDVTRFAQNSLAKSARRHRKSRTQQKQLRILKAIQPLTKKP